MKTKILRFVLGALFVVFWTHDANAVAPTNQYLINASQTSGYGYSPTYQTTVAAVCSAFGSFATGKDVIGNTDWRFTGVILANTSSCKYETQHKTVVTAFSSVTYGVGTYPRCAGGGAPDTTKPLDQQCPDPNPCVKDMPGPDVDVTMGWRTGPSTTSAFAQEYPSPYSSGATWCNGTCTISPGSPTECNLEQTPSGVGYYRSYCVFHTQQTGGQCTGVDDPNAGKNPPTDPPPEKNRCPLGTKQIGIDSAGIPICKGDAPPPNPPTVKTETTKTTNPDGSTTETTTKTTTNSDGSKTTETTTKTTWPDGRSTSEKTTATGTKADGSAGTSDSSEQDQSDLCKRNPTLNICRNSQISGQCENVSCDGDAITCAIAREVAARNCRDKAAEDAIKASSEYALGKAVMAGNDPMGSSLPSKANAEQVHIGALSADGFGGGGACFSDRTVLILGRSLTFQFSAFCNYLIVFRYVVMLIALILSFKMLSGAVLRR